MPKLMLVLPSRNPDLDGVACAVGCTEWISQVQGRRATAAVFGQPDPEAGFYIDHFGGANLEFNPPEPFSDADIVYVDASSLHGFPSHLRPECVVEVIDHRLHGEPHVEFPRAQIVVELVGSAATLVAERFMLHETDPSPITAALLLGAIQSNTQRLRGAVTTARDIAASEWAMSFVPDHARLLRKQLFARREAIVHDLVASINSETKQYCHFNVDYAVTQLELLGGEEWFADTHETLERVLLSQPLPTMLNVVDVSTARSVLFIPSESLRSFTHKKTALEFDGDHVILEPATLRKQIVDAIAGLRPLE